MRTPAAGTTFSVVIPNYNYERFLRSAVESALALDWPDVEVIVVDDGSTDGSLDVLSEFGDRITVLTQANAGPRVACNRGFEASTGDIVIFLDSDDQLEPSIAREVMAMWRPGISKVQVQMQRVDAHGEPRGGVFPRFDDSLSPELVRAWMTETGAYPTPPGPGNAYARDFLDRLFPLDERCGDAADSACLAAAPYLGDVVTIGKPLVRYRVHERNRSKLREPRQFTQQVERAYQRHRFAMQLSGEDASPDAVVPPLRRGLHLLQMRVAERRLNGDREPPVPQDDRRRLIQDTLTVFRVPGPESPSHRLLVAGWCFTTLSTPLPLARVLITWRFG